MRAPGDVERERRRRLRLALHHRPRELVVDGRAITRDGPAYVIAEIGNNHQGDLEKAKALIHAARECGVDAVKFQKRDNRALFTREFYESPYDNEQSYGRDVRRAPRVPRAAEERLVRADALRAGGGRRVRRAASTSRARTCSPSSTSTRSSSPRATSSTSRSCATSPRSASRCSSRPAAARSRTSIAPSTRSSPRNEQLCVLHCTAAYPADVEDLNLVGHHGAARALPGPRDRALRPSQRDRDGAGRVHARRAGLREALHAQPRVEGHRPRVLADARRDAPLRARPASRPGRARRRRQATLPSEERRSRRWGRSSSRRAISRPGTSSPGRPRREVAGGRGPPARTSSTTSLGAHARAPLAVEETVARGRRRARRGARRRATRDDLTEIRLVVFDFDGVFSDNRVWTNERGEESVACWRGDSLGLRRLDEVGVDYFVLTPEANDAVPARARKIRIECIRASRTSSRCCARRPSGAASLAPRPRTSATTSTTRSASRRSAPVVPGDAWPEVVPLAGSGAHARGGHGCVREFCDAVWNAKRAVAA